MSEFRSYLDNRGSVLSQNQELAAYFALPYIPEPAKHPTFQNLFMVSAQITDQPSQMGPNISSRYEY